MSMCVCVCPSAYIPWGRALLLFVCVCVCVFLHSSKCTAGIPGHLQKQREADRWAEEVVGSECRLPEKRVREKGMRKCWRAWMFCSPTPCKQPWVRGRMFDTESSRLHCKQTLLYCNKILYSLILCLSWCFFVCFFEMENECSLPWVNCVCPPDRSS